MDLRTEYDWADRGNLFSKGWIICNKLIRKGERHKHVHIDLY